VKMEVEGQTTFRRVPLTEYSQAALEQAGYPPLTPEALEQMALGYGMIGDALAGGGGDMPPMDVRGMTGDMSAFLRAGASHEGDDGQGDAANAMSDMAEFARRARLAGTEPAPASSNEAAPMQDAFLIVAEELSDIELDQPEGNAQFTLEKISLWIDTEQYVPLRLLMEGQVESKGTISPITIEKLDLDYDQVGPLYESFQQVYRLEGFMAAMSEKEQKELEKAQEEMAKAKEQLASMPEQQRAMVMKMMGSQMEKLEQMTAGGEITSITDVVSVAINEGPPTPYGPGDLTVGGPAATVYPGALTYAGENETGNGLAAELAIVARVPGSAEAMIGLHGNAPFPQSGSVDVVDATGSVSIEGGVEVILEGGSGTITVTERTATRIAGTYTVLLTGFPSTATDGETVSFSAEGNFDSGAPVGPYQAPRGSPFPADLFGGQ